LRELASEPFREVARLYVPVEEGLDTYQRGEWISFLLDDGWGVFSDRIWSDDLAQDLICASAAAAPRPTRSSSSAPADFSIPGSSRSFAG
jgi:hypothetical protein